MKSFLSGKLAIAAIVVVVAVGGYLAWKKATEPSSKEKYKFYQVAYGDVTQTVSANGTLNPVVLVNVGTQVSGTVQKWSADFNDRVEKGQVLMTLDPALYKAQVAQSKANVKNAQANLDFAMANEPRVRELYKNKYSSKQDWDTAIQALKVARAQLAVANAQLEKDMTNLNYTVIRSPVSGIVVSRNIDVGQTVAASFQTPTLYIIAQDLHMMQIDSSYAEADIGGIKVGQTAMFTVDAYPSRNFTGTVRQIRINPTTQQNVVTYDVVVNVKNDDEALLPGMTAYVNIIIAQKKHILTVPNSALRFKPPKSSQKRGGGNKPAGAEPEKEEKHGRAEGTVYTFENGNFRQIRVGLGITDNKTTEIASGQLKAGDGIIQEEIIPEESDKGGFRMRMF
jgi:HlyD family secretion protein